MKDDTEYILITDKFIYIKNYIKIINLDNKEVVVKLNKKSVKMLGNNLSLTECDNKEVKISGNIESLIKYDN